LVRHEGLKLKPYHCTAGKLTIGIGRNLEDKGISETEAYLMLDNDIKDVESEIRGLVLNYDDLDDVRKRVVLNMAFNLGMTRLRGFKKFLANLRVRNFSKAAIEMLDSRWAQQVGRRALELAQWMRTGVDTKIQIG
jgi:lysozyme